MHEIVLWGIVVSVVVAMSLIGIAIVEGGDRTVVVIWKSEVLHLYTTFEIREFLGALRSDLPMRRGPVAFATNEGIRILRQSDFPIFLSQEEIRALKRFNCGRDRSIRALRCIVVRESHPLAEAAERLSRKYATQASYARWRNAHPKASEDLQDEVPIIIAP